MYAVCPSGRLSLEGAGKLALTFALRPGRASVVVGHRERKALIVRVGCGMARRGRGRLLGGRVSTKSPASVENVGGDGGGESFGVRRRKRQGIEPCRGESERE